MESPAVAPPPNTTALRPSQVDPAKAPEPEASRSEELRILTTGSDGKMVLTDKNGVDHVLPPLDIMDMVEFEEKLKTSLANLVQSGSLGLSEIFHLLYLSMRKEGCSPDQISKRDWKYPNEAAVFRLFDLKLLSKAPELFRDLMKVSGIDLRPQPQAGQK